MKHLTVEEVISRLESRGYTVKKSGGVWRSQCPAHDGDGLNLAFTTGNKGQVIFTCHSHQCSYEEIMTSLGFEKQAEPKKTKTSKTVHPTFEKAVAASMYGAEKRDWPPDIVYRYNNEDGSENFFMLRWNTGNGKLVRPITKIDGGYICGEPPNGIIPVYNLPNVSKHIRDSSDTVRIFVTEGEKAAESANSLGVITTTSAFGSSSAHKAEWGTLDRLATEHGKKLEIVILPDNDKPGEEYAESLVDIFAKFKSKPIVKIVSLAKFSSITGIANFPSGGGLLRPVRTP